jgi:hypothetical protein
MFVWTHWPASNVFLLGCKSRHAQGATPHAEKDDVPHRAVTSAQIKIKGAHWPLLIGRKQPSTSKVYGRRTLKVRHHLPTTSMAILNYQSRTSGKFAAVTQMCTTARGSRYAQAPPLLQRRAHMGSKRAVPHRCSASSAKPVQRLSRSARRPLDRRP